MTLFGGNISSAKAVLSPKKEGSHVDQNHVHRNYVDQNYVDQINPYRGLGHCNTRPWLTGIRGELRRVFQ